MNNVVRRLWEWANDNGDWARALVQIITSENVDEEQRLQILNTLLYEHGIIKEFEKKTVEGPSSFEQSNNGEKLILKELTNIQGVNKLAKEQVLKFSPNLTVIYGNNGSGKSGYGRILKSVGFSYDSNLKVLPDVFSNDNYEQKADIYYKVGERDKTFSWNNSSSSVDLKSIGMFNSDCVKISLDNNRNLIATPVGFHYFNEVSSELNKLSQEITNMIDRKSIEPDFFTKLHNGTHAFNFITSLKTETNEETIENETKFELEDEQQILQLNKEKEGLNVQLLNNEIQACQNQVKELDELNIKINKMKEVLNTSVWNEYKETLQTLKYFEEERTTGLKQSMMQLNGNFIQSEEFINFLESAEKYIKTLEQISYPNEKDVCIYCGQPLDVNARELIKSYRELIDNTLKSKIEKLGEKLDDLNTKISKVDSSCQLHHNPFETEDEEIVPRVISLFFTEYTRLKNIVLKHPKGVFLEQSFRLDYESVTNFIKKRSEEVLELKKQKETILGRIQEKQNEMENKINELKDKKVLYDNKVKLKEYVDNLKMVVKLENVKGLLNTRSLSRISTLARKELIQDQFKEVFENELKHLKCEKNISLDFGTQAGSPKLRQVIGSQYSLGDVLSEGEQKSIALAHLLTELKISNQFGPIIFDDPVNSLDHERINIVAQRLIRLSEERQVIILTHSILFFNSIEQFMKDRKPNINYKYYTVESKGNSTGHLYEDTPPHKEKFRTYQGKIKDLLNTSAVNKEVMGSSAAIQGYGYLRSAIELLVEDEIFKSVIKRYRRDIKFGQVEEIDGQGFDNVKQELTDIFNEACAYIDAHSNPLEAAYTPNLNQLERDLNRVIAIKSRF
ncbi:AAA family ATPase [Mesobacillus thioparans]|uniref:AAA family ATPase n=1 Tax=Mesobacillus thioparans TaxID=370439 RepID=UPI0039EFFAEC